MILEYKQSENSISGSENINKNLTIFLLFIIIKDFPLKCQYIVNN